MELYKLNSIENIEKLLLNCRDTRHTNICNIIGNIGPIYIKAIIITNDFQKPVIDPYFLYITMLPIDIITIDSIMSFEIVNNKMQIKIYTDNNDNVTGIKYNLDLLKRLDIKLENLIGLPANIEYLDYNIKKKLNNLRVIKDDWEFLQINDCMDMTIDIFKNMCHSINSKKISSEQQLESIYYQYMINNGFTVPYLPIIASSVNASHIHYFNNNSSIYSGSTILMDCGVKNRYGYASDITRTIINEQSDIQNRVYAIVKKAHDNCVEFIEQNLNTHKQMSFNNLDSICINTYITEFGKFETDPRYLEWSEGILNCKLKSFNKASRFIKQFYTHFIGHHIGLDTHDPYDDNLLKERSVFTIEPGLYFNKMTIGFTIPEEYYELGGVRIEDMYGILKKEGSLQLIHLSIDIPKK